ncbi:MAG: STAS domain-containing protein [Archangium sp.]
MISAQHEAGTTTLTVDGKFNFGCYQDFHGAIAGVSASQQFVVDLRRATYLDSAALGMLLLLRDRVGADPSRVVLRVGDGQPRDVLQLANFAKLFTIA